MKIFIMRHGNARWSNQDNEQALTKLGIEEANFTGIHLKKNYKIDLILHSKKLRAKQTAKIVANLFPNAEIQQHDKILPESDPQNIIEDLKYVYEQEKVLIVSHMPFVHELAYQLVNPEDRRKLTFFNTAAFALLESNDKENFKFIEYCFPQKIN